LSQIVVILTGAVLFYVAFTDFKHYKIRNEVVLVLAALFLLYVFIIGSWATLAWNSGFAALAFLFMLVCYSTGLMGGGDVKLLTVALLWVGPFCAVPFAIFLLFFASIHTLAAKLKLVEALVDNGGKQRIAFAPSLAAALITVFLVGCLNDSMRSAVYGGLGRSLYQLMRQILPGIG
jgi:prepilin peptidase CpaA